MPLAVIVWPLLAAIGAAGLLAVAPRRAPFIYLGPAACTVGLVTLAATYVAALWSH